jgi:hypothetical protein
MQAAGCPCTVHVLGIYVDKLVLFFVALDLLPKVWSNGM